MTETNTVLDETRSAAVQPGDLTAKLVAYRTGRNMEQEQAAEEMHLPLHILRALEREDFAHLPEYPYVCGYLRGYAKLAEKDDRELIRIYKTLCGADPDAVGQKFSSAKSHNKVNQPALSSSTLKFIIFGSVVLVLGLISMIPGVRDWAQNTWSDFSAQTNAPEVPRPPAAIDTFAAQKAAEEKAAEEAQAKQEATATQAATDNSSKAATDTPAANAASNEPVAAETKPVSTEPVAAETKPVSTEPVAAETKPASTDNTATTPIATTTETASAASTTTTAASTTPASTTATPAAATTAVSATTPAPTDPAALPAGTPPVAGTPTTTDPNAPPTTPPQPIAGEVTVKMEFSEEVWVQIKNEGKKTVFEALNSPGSTKEFKATTPLNFKIGNANGVKMYLNGQPYDQSPYIKGSVARFKVE